MYVVCRFKDDNSLFITTRKSRDSMVKVLHDLGQPIESNVVKVCETYDEAMKYIKEMKDVDKKIDEL